MAILTHYEEGGKFLINIPDHAEEHFFFSLFAKGEA